MTTEKASASFEETLSELEAIVNEMESGDLPLNKALEKFNFILNAYPNSNYEIDILTKIKLLNNK